MFCVLSIWLLSLAAGTKACAIQLSSSGELYDFLASSTATEACVRGTLTVDRVRHFSQPVTLAPFRNITFIPDPLSPSRATIDVQMAVLVNTDETNRVTFDRLKLINAYQATPNTAITNTARKGALILTNVEWTGYWYDLQLSEFFLRLSYQAGRTPYKAKQMEDGSLFVEEMGPFTFTHQANDTYQEYGHTGYFRNVAFIQIAGPPPYNLPPETLDVDSIPDESLVCMLRADFGYSYRGFVNTTINGKTCQPWLSQIPHLHAITPFNFPDRGLFGNLCRNPVAFFVDQYREDKVWCYTRDPIDRYQPCPVPWCDELTPAEIKSKAAEFRALYKVNKLGPVPAPPAPPTPSTNGTSTSKDKHDHVVVGLAVGISVGLSALLVIIALIWWRVRVFRRGRAASQLAGQRSSLADDEEAHPATTQILKTFNLEPETIKLNAHLDTGGSGSVYKATYLDEDVAVKIMFVDEKVKDEGLNEILMGILLVHPNCVRHYGFFRTLVQIKTVWDNGVQAGQIPVFYDSQPTMVFMTPGNSHTDVSRPASQGASNANSNDLARPLPDTTKRRTLGIDVTEIRKQVMTNIQSIAFGLAPQAPKLAPISGQSAGSAEEENFKRSNNDSFTAAAAAKTAGKFYSQGIGGVVGKLRSKKQDTGSSSTRSSDTVDKPRVAVCIVTELMDISLFHAMAKGSTEARLGPDVGSPALLGVPDLNISLTIAMQAASGLRQIHQKHIHHGDMKSLNILLRNRTHSIHPIAKICDFGTAQFRKSKPRGTVRVTAMFLAPEVQDTLRTSVEADLYAFGVTMWELLHPDWATWQTPYEHPVGSYFVYPTPLAWAELIAKCCRPGPLDRPTSTQVVHELQAIQDMLGLRGRSARMTADDILHLASVHPFVTGPIQGPYRTASLEVIAHWLRSRILGGLPVVPPPPAPVVQEAGSSYAVEPVVALPPPVDASHLHLQQAPRLSSLLLNAGEGSAMTQAGLGAPFASVSINHDREVTLKFDSIFY